MADLYTALQGLTPSAAEITQAELLAVQVLGANYPDTDTRVGTGVRDLVIRPAAFLLALLEKGLNYYFTQNTILGVDDSTPTDVVDSILSNWFLTRNTGTYAVISARLYFARAKNISIPTTVWFSPDNTLMYSPQTTVTVPASAVQYDAYQNEYYIDVSLQAQSQGTNYNLSSGSLLYFSNFDPYFLHAEISYLITSSVAAETNTQFINRASTAISTRNLINNPSIISNLEQEFNYLTQVQPIGMGDPEMVRDQIQAVFNPEAARLLTSLTSSGTTATATLADHGWFTGQIVTILGATPSIYNGQYTITVIDDSDFTYELLTPATVVTELPTVQSVTTPLLIHNGGMVDVYCDNNISNSTVQLTTDQFGNATLSGPVYAFSRSSTSGSSTADTIPLTEDVDYTSTSISAGIISVAATNHGLTSSTVIQLSGLVQTLTISAITCSGVTVTITSDAHGLTGDPQITVAGVTPTTYNGTFTATVVDANTLTYTVPSTISGAGSGSPMTMTNPTVTGSFGVTIIGPNSFDIVIPTIWTAATNMGTMVMAYATPYTTTNPYLQSVQLGSLTCSGTTVTATLQNHGQTNNRYVWISGATPSTYNGQWLITSVPNANEFTYTVPATIGSAATGTLMLTSIIPWYDVGFSSRQELTIGFGSSYANSTASFDISQFTYAAGVQTYLEDATNRVMCGDLLARGFNFYLLNVTVIGYANTIPDSGTVQSTCQTYLAGLVPGAVFIMSDLVGALETAGIVSIQTPLTITYTKYTRDLITPITGTITDYLDPNDPTNVFLLGNVSTSTQAV